MTIYKGKASSFADTADKQKYQTALVTLLRAGLSTKEAAARARKVGDPGIGWLDNDLSNAVPWCAVPYECWQQRWGPKEKAHKQRVKCTIGGITRTLVLGDTMPHLANIENGAVIDLAPGAQAAFGLRAPFMLPAQWWWEADEQPAAQVSLSWWQRLFGRAAPA